MRTPLGIIAAFSLSLVVLIQAQSGALTGTVQDESGSILPTVAVMVKGLKGLALTRSTVTNADGTFTFVDLPAGKYDVTFTLEGFRSVRRKNVAVRSDVKATVNVRMRIDPGARFVIARALQTP